MSKTTEGIITFWNRAAERIFGYTAQEAVGKPILIIIPTDREGEEAGIISRILAGERVDHFETVRRRKDGQLVDISVTISPVRDASGRIVGASKVARDITDRKRIEAELSLYRHGLEQQVQARTQELERSHAMLRIAERFASLGTLSAGLGHDMGNLLLPIAARVDALRREPLSAEGRTDIDAIEASIKYLQTLSRALRMLAMDPENNGGAGAKTTDVEAWWPEVRPVLRAALPRSISLVWEGLRREEGESEADPVGVLVPPHQLTQAAFNLTQNAGEALLQGPTAGAEVRVGAAIHGGRVLIRVADNGPGMTEEVRRRCMEPFFSTKTRQLSTGMGLAMVRAMVERCGGSLRVESEPGRGAAFTIDLPAAPVAGRAGEGQVRRGARVMMTVRDARLSAYTKWVLSSYRAVVVTGDEPRPGEVDLWIAEAGPGVAERMERLVNEGGRGVLLRRGSPRPAEVAIEGWTSDATRHDPVVKGGAGPSLEDIRGAVRRALAFPGGATASEENQDVHGRRAVR